MRTLLTVALAIAMGASALAQDRNRTPPRCKDVCGWVNITRCDRNGMNCVTTREWVCPNWCRD